MYPNTFYRVSIKALIKDNQGRVLVVKENQDTWSLPGGGLDHGEDPQAGVLRELREELGIKNATVSDIATIKAFYLEHKSAWLLWIVYEVIVSDDELHFGEGVTAAQYIDPESFASSQDIFEKLVSSVVGDNAIRIMSRK